MRSVRPPDLNHEQLYKECASQARNRADREILLAMTGRMVRAGQDYAKIASAGRLDSCVSIDMSPQEERLVRTLYDKRLVSKRGIGRFAYDEIRTSTSICPFCSFGETYEVDHYLSKRFFPDLNILPNNLVPICHPCNHIKLDRRPEAEDRLLLHPYFDHLPNVRWLYAELIYEAGGPLLKYWVELDERTHGSLARRLQYHFSTLQLDRRFGEMAATVLVELESDIARHLTNLAPKEIMVHFEERGELSFARHGNTLETAAFLAAAQNRDYCSGHYRN